MRALIRGLVVVAVYSAGALSFGGCGYHVGYRAPPSVRTIAVPIFNNETFPLRRDIEYELTAALRRDIQARTGLRLVAENEADMVVIGTVADFQEWVVAEGRQDQKLESNIMIVIDLAIEDYVNGTRRTQRVRDVEPLSVEAGSLIEVARVRAIDDLAEKVLMAIESW